MSHTTYTSPEGKHDKKNENISQIGSPSLSTEYTHLAKGTFTEPARTLVVVYHPVSGNVSPHPFPKYKAIGTGFLETTLDWQ